jgi:hypothetical protein
MSCAVFSLLLGVLELALGEIRKGTTDTSERHFDVYRVIILLFLYT